MTGVQTCALPIFFLFAFLAAIATCIGLSIAPARRAWRTDPYQRLAVPGGPRRLWALRDAVLAGQIALCGILVTASFVSLRGLVESLTMPLGIDPRGVATAAARVAGAAFADSVQLGG